jgi:hypothetical protein
MHPAYIDQYDYIMDHLDDSGLWRRADLQPGFLNGRRTLSQRLKELEEAGFIQGSEPVHAYFPTDSGGYEEWRDSQAKKPHLHGAASPEDAQLDLLRGGDAA